MPESSTGRRYRAFLSYRHADNAQEGRRWAEWLHRSLERYIVPPDLVGTSNQRGEAIPDSLYPIFRDEDELPADADLATGIRRALERSECMIVLCSPRSAQSPWVRQEVREFKEMGRSDRLLAVILAGEPNADDPIKGRDGVFPEEECFPCELRTGVAVSDERNAAGYPRIDWAARTEPLAADLRPHGRRAEGFTSAAAYKEHLTLHSSFDPAKIEHLAKEYGEQLEHARLKIIAGILGIPLSQLEDRDARHRTELAEKEAQRQKEIAERERALAEQARQASERLKKRNRVLAVASAMVCVLAVFAFAQVRRANKETINARNHATAATNETRRAETEAATARNQTARVKEEAERADEAAKLAKENWDKAEAHKQKAEQNADIALENARRSRHSAYIANIAGADAALRLGDVAAAKQRLATVPFNLRGWEWCHLYSRADESSRTIELGTEVYDMALSPDGSLLALPFGDTAGVALWRTSNWTLTNVFFGHTKLVRALAFTPDGRLIASGGWDKMVKVFNVAGGTNVATLDATEIGLVNDIAFSADGRWIGAGGVNKKVIIWETTTWSPHLTQFVSNVDVKALVFAPFGDELFSGWNTHSIAVWRTSNGLEALKRIEVENLVTSLAINGAGRWVVAGQDDGAIAIASIDSLNVLTNFFGHRVGVTALAFSANGDFLASGSEDNDIRLWEAKTWRELKVLRGHTDEITALAFMPDGRWLISASEDDTIKLWDLENDRVPLFSHEARDEVRAVAFSPDGRWLCDGISSSDSSKTIEFRDPKTGDLEFTLDHAGVASLSFSPDSKQLISGSFAGGAKVWNLEQRREITHLGATNETFHSVVWSPLQDKIVTASEVGGVILSQVSDTSKTRKLDSGRGWRTLAFSPDGTLICGGGLDGRLKLWKVSSGEELVSMPARGACTTLTFSPDGKRIAAGVGETIRIWSVETREEILRLLGHTKVVNQVCFDADGTRLFSGAEDRSLRVWDAATGEELYVSQGQRGAVFGVAASMDGRHVAIGSARRAKGIVEIMSATTRPNNVPFQLSRNDALTALQFEPGSHKLAAATADGPIEFWDFESGAHIHRLTGHASQSLGLAFSPDAKTLASGSLDTTVRLWDVKTGRALRRLEGHTREVASVAFSMDGTSMVSCASNNIIVWNTATGDIKQRIQCEELVSSLAYTKDGMQFISASPLSIRSWDVESGRELTASKISVTNHQVVLYRITLSPDNETIVGVGCFLDRWQELLDRGIPVDRLAFFAPGALVIANRVTRNVRAISSGDESVLATVAISPDGKLIATGSWSGNVRLWNLATGEPIGKAIEHKPTVLGLGFSSDGKTLASASVNGTVMLWDISVVSKTAD